MTRHAIVGLALFLVACQGEDFDRLSLKDQGLSIRSLPNWELSRDRGSVILRGPDRATIVIRAVARQDPRSDERTDNAVVVATEKVLRSYPKATLEGPTKVEDSNLDGVSYSLTFRPSGKDRTYERRHVVLFGQGRVYHLWHTAPRGKLKETEKEFAQIVASSQGEV